MGNGNKTEITLKREPGLALLKYDPYNATKTEKKKLSGKISLCKGEHAGAMYQSNDFLFDRDYSSIQYH